MKKTQIARLRTGAALSAFVLAGSLFAAPAFAQDTPAAATAPQTEAPASDGEIVVTGTIFRQSDTHTALPVTVITAENLERAGITNVTDAIRSASADGAGSIGNGFTSGFSAGGAAVSLADRRNYAILMRLALLAAMESKQHGANLGFRCARDVPPETAAAQ